MITLSPIAVVESPFAGKFAVPRQSGLAPSIESFVRVDAAWTDGLTGLEGVSHVWLLFLFHAVPPGRVSTRVRPPRLGGNARTGVFSTRSTHRPNPLGLSLVQLVSVEADGLRVTGGDLLDGTPIVDIKPYLPWSDSAPDAHNALAPEPPEQLVVEWSVKAQAALEAACGDDVASVRQQLSEVLAFDARPAYHADASRHYAVEIAQWHVQWRHLANGVVEVVAFSER